MKNFIFKTNATMKKHNNKKWWIDKNVIGEIYISAETLKEALNRYRDKVNNDYYVTISENAIKNKRPMYIGTKDGDEKQVGFVITGKTDFQNDYGNWTEQYIDLWVEILTVVDTEF